MAREVITDENIKFTISIFKNALGIRLNEKGFGSFTSSHEILGVVTEEYWELIGAIKSNNQNSILHELMDIAVGCIFAYACIQNGKTDW